MGQRQAKACAREWLIIKEQPTCRDRPRAIAPAWCWRERCTRGTRLHRQEAVGHVRVWLELDCAINAQEMSGPQ